MTFASDLLEQTSDGGDDVRAKRPCCEPGCASLVTASSSRCPAHARAKDRARGTRHERGYGADHDRLRRQWAIIVATGAVTCWRCGVLLHPDAFDLGHDDHDRSQYAGPECRPCNRATAGRSGGAG